MSKLLPCCWKYKPQGCFFKVHRGLSFPQQVHPDVKDKYGDMLRNNFHLLICDDADARLHVNALQPSHGSESPPSNVKDNSRGGEHGGPGSGAAFSPASGGCTETG